MKQTLLVFFSLATLCLSVLADGYPFDPHSQRVTEPTLRLKLSQEQIREISATGILTFSDQHLRLLRRYYPAATKRTDVITATFNDNNEGLTDEDVHCFWVAPEEVAVTLNEKHPRDKSPFDVAPGQRFPTDAELKEVAARHIRLSPDGTIYFRGQQITLQQAFALIDDIARFPKPDPNHVTANNDRWLYVVVPPPAAGRELLYADADNQRTPQQIFDTLTVYAAAKSIEVGREW